MSQFIDGNYKAFLAGAAIPQWSLVKLSAAGVVIATALAADEFIGVNSNAAFAAGDPVTVRLRSGSGTTKMIADSAFAVGAVVYGRIGGRVDDVSTSSAIRAGIALEAATAQNDIVEVITGSP